MTAAPAMAVAMIYPKPANVSKNAKEDKTASATEPVHRVSSGRLSMARTVLADSRAIAEKVMSGAQRATEIRGGRAAAGDAEEQGRAR